MTPRALCTKRPWLSGSDASYSSCSHSTSPNCNSPSSNESSLHADIFLFDTTPLPSTRLPPRPCIDPKSNGENCRVPTWRLSARLPQPNARSPLHSSLSLSLALASQPASSLPHVLLLARAMKASGHPPPCAVYRATNKQNICFLRFLAFKTQTISLCWNRDYFFSS